MCIQDAVRALKARLTDATAALQISHSEALRLRTRVADLKAAVSVSSRCACQSVLAWCCWIGLEAAACPAAAAVWSCYQRYNMSSIEYVVGLVCIKSRQAAAAHSFAPGHGTFFVHGFPPPPPSRAPPPSPLSPLPVFRMHTHACTS